MKRPYNSNGAGDAVYSDGENPQEVIAETGTAPAAMHLAQMLNAAYQRGRTSMAKDLRHLINEGAA